MTESSEMPKQPRQWLDIAAFSIAVVSAIWSVAWSGFTFYFSDLRISDDFSAVFLTATTDLDTNSTPFVRIDLALRNEGNRPAIIRQIGLSLSETAAFDLPIHHYWENDAVLFVEPKTTIHQSLSFGRGYTNNPIIISRGHHEPPIYARLVYDVIDAHAGLHRVEEPIGIFQYRDGLKFFWKKAPPWQARLLPSTSAPPYIVNEISSGLSVAIQVPLTNGMMVPVTNDGPLGVRFVGAQTNDVSGGWLVKKIKPVSTSWRVGL